MEMVPFKDRIREYLEIRELTQTDVARKLNYSSQAISKWVMGKATPNLGDIPDIAAKLDVSPFWLAGYPNVPMSVGAANKELQEIFRAKVEDNQVQNDAPQQDVNGSLFPVYTEEQLDKRMAMIERAMDLYEKGKISEKMLELIVKSLR